MPRIPFNNDYFHNGLFAHDAKYPSWYKPQVTEPTDPSGGPHFGGTTGDVSFSNTSGSIEGFTANASDDD